MHKQMVQVNEGLINYRQMWGWGLSRAGQVHTPFLSQLNSLNIQVFVSSAVVYNTLGYRMGGHPSSRPSSSSVVVSNRPSTITFWSSPKPLARFSSNLVGMFRGGVSTKLEPNSLMHFWGIALLSPHKHVIRLPFHEISYSTSTI